MIDNERTKSDDKELIEEIELNQENKVLVEEQLNKFSLLDETNHPVKTYRLTYFS